MTTVPAPYGRAALQNSSSFSRVFEAAGCRTQAELAKFLGIRQSSISDAKKRGSVPADWLLSLLCKKWINPTWVLTGQGTQMLQPLEHIELLAEKSVQIMVHCPPPQCTTDELLQEILRRTMQAIAPSKDI